MKRIFSILIALVLVFTAIPVFETEAMMRPEKTVFYITYKPGSGASGRSSTDGPYDVGSSVTLPSASSLGFEKEGYYCTGWSIGPEGGTYTNNGTGSLGDDNQYHVNAVAQWAKNGTSSSSSSSSESSSSESSSSTASSTGVYRVTYYPGEAGGSSYIRRYAFDENFETVSCPFEYKDHVFAGWEYKGDLYPADIYEAGQGFRAPNENVAFTAVWKAATGASSSSSSSVAPPPPSSSSAPAPSTSTSSRPSNSSSSSSSESSEPESSESSSSVVEAPVENTFKPVSLAFSINGDIPVTKIEFLLKEDINGEPTINIVPLDGYSVTDEAAAKLIADGDALAAFDLSLLSDGMAYKGSSLGTVTYTLNGTQANAESNYDSYVFAMVHTVSADKHVGEYYMTDGELVYLYNPETDFKTAVDNVKLVEEDGVYRLVIKDPSGLSSFAYEAAEGLIVEVKLVASASAESASIDVTSLSPVLLAHIEVGEGKSSGAGIPVWVWILIVALVLVVGILVALFLISRRSGTSSSTEKRSSGSYSGITGFDDEE